MSLLGVRARAGVSGEAGGGEGGGGSTSGWVALECPVSVASGWSVPKPCPPLPTLCCLFIHSPRRRRSRGLEMLCVLCSDSTTQELGHFGPISCPPCLSSLISTMGVTTLVNQSKGPTQSSGLWIVSLRLWVVLPTSCSLLLRGPDCGCHHLL